MDNFEVRETGLMLLKGMSLYILPYYKTNKEDPNIRLLLPRLEAATQNMILKPHPTGEIIETQLTGRSYVWLVCLSEGAPYFALKSVLNTLLIKLEKSNYKNIAFGQLAMIEYGCDDEDKWARTQKKALEDFAAKHPEKNILLIEPNEGFRPNQGPHLGDGILPETEDEPLDVIPHSSHQQVALNLRLIKSYCQYFEEYIEARNRQYEFIPLHGKKDGDDEEERYIKNLEDLQIELRDREDGKRIESFAKWQKPLIHRWTKEKYYAVPGKQKLKLIIMLLDMNYDEAVACLNFFGYGLARFDPEDMAYAYILKNSENWPRPLDILHVNKTLKKRFGAKASLVANHKKKGEK